MKLAQLKKFHQPTSGAPATSSGMRGTHAQVLLGRRAALLSFYPTQSSGSGLGLTLCREIIEAHGGRLSLANRTGGGALLTIWLP
jgi:light-regulated signal transduction histidine kinase (bacteriophytochrome)